MTRLFLGCWPEEYLARCLHAHATEHCRTHGGRVLTSGNLHMTLAFLGQQPEARQSAAITAARQAVAGRAAFMVQLDRIGGRRDLLWARCRRTPAELAALVSALGDALADHGFEVGRRRFLPHVTLARDTRPVITDTGALPAWWVHQLLLVESTLMPGGAIYTPLAHLALQ